MPVSAAARHTGEQTALLDWTVPIRPSQAQKLTNPLLLRQNLHLIARIVSFLDDPADLARACRTCRILHYMCIPLLYSDVSLVHHTGIRISNETGRPLGCGGATPFFMGLNALVTNNVTNFVRSLEIKGEWRKKGEAGFQEEEESARLGLVPDGHMMLSLLVRTAVERCTSIQKFHWDIDTKMLPTVWAGLASRPNLTHVSIRMPSSRAPMPVIDAPPIPTLTHLSIYDIDPLCYPDALSSILFGSKKLEHLKLHWSPRMRRAREPSTNIQSYFGKCLAGQYAMPLKHFSMQNLYSLGGGDFGGIVSSDTIESYCLLSSMPGENDTADMAFVGYNWQWAPPSPLRMPHLKTLRGDKISRRHATVLGAFSGLEHYYLISGRKLEDKPFDERPPTSLSNGRNGATPTHSSNGENGTTTSPGGSSMADTPLTPGDRASPTESYSYAASASIQSAATAERAVAALGPAYLEAIVSRHSPTLKHLLLMPHWRLTPEELVRLVHATPNFEQLGVGVDAHSFAAMAARQNGRAPDAFRGNVLGLVLKLVQPYAKRLRVLRLLDSPRETDVSDEVARAGGDAAMEDRIAKQTWGREFDGLRWIGLGEYVFEIKSVASTGKGGSNGGSNGSNTIRKCRRRPVKMVMGSSGLEVFRMDRLTLDV